ncbi:MAG: cupin domain-containing protein [Chloroflexi bacterium]|nr:cupin domain-containing protein [Chloroflexota bacterium]
MTIEQIKFARTGIWRLDEPPTDTSAGSEPSGGSIPMTPAASGMTFMTVELPPDASVSRELDMAALGKEMASKVPGMMQALDPSRGVGMHRTDTIDFVTVVSGEVFLKLDDGAEVHLSAGDLVVQRGTWHAWRNRSSEPCILSAVMVSAKKS